MAHVVASRYIQGSGGRRCVVFRRAGEPVQVEGVDYTIPAERGYVVQWGSGALYDSGYASEHFSSLTAALRALHAD